MKSIFTVCFLSLFLHAKAELKVSDKVFVAADMRHSCSGGFKYQVELDLYTECGLTGGILENQNFFLISIESSKLGVLITDTVQKSDIDVSIRNGTAIKLLCQSKDSQCETNEFTDDRGVRLYKYKGEIDLSAYDETDDWRVSWDQSSRSELLGTVEDEQPAYTENIINTKNGCNSSPSFDALSIVRVTSGSPTVVTLGASDINGDNLSYSLVAPKVRKDENITYIGGASPTAPISVSTPLSITTDGKLTIESDAGESNGIVDILVEERNSNNEIVGTSRKSMHIASIISNNSKPIISGFDGTDDVFEKTICAGESLTQLNSVFSGSDLDGDNSGFLATTSIKWADNMTPYFSIFRRQTSSKITDPKAWLQWTPQAKDTGQVVITVTLEDDQCPEEQQIQDFVINVNPIPNFDLGESKVFVCSDPFTLDPQPTHGGNSITYTWIEGIDTLSNASTYFVDRSIDLKLTVTDDAGCSFTDSVSYLNSITPKTKIIRNCVDRNTEIVDLSTFYLSEFVAREWVVDTGGGVMSVPVLDTIRHEYSGPGEYPYELILENDLGCIDTLRDTLTIFDHPLVKSDVYVICDYYDGLIEDGLFTDPTGRLSILSFNFGEFDGADFKDDTDYNNGDEWSKVTWTVLNTDSSLAPSTYTENPVESFNRPNEISARDYQDYPMPDSGEFIIELAVETSSGCLDTVYRDVTLKQRPQIEALSGPLGNKLEGLEGVLSSALKYPYHCNDPDTTFSAVVSTNKIGSGPLEWFWYDQDTDKTTTPDSIGVVNPGDTVRFPAGEPGVYTVGVRDSVCVHYQEYIIELNIEAGGSLKEPCFEGETVKFEHNEVQTSPSTELEKKTQSYSPYGIETATWYFGDGDSLVVSNNDTISHVYPIQDEYPVTLKVVDSAGCDDNEQFTAYYTFPIVPVNDLVTTDPDILVNQVCAKNTVEGVGFTFNPFSSVDYQYLVQSITWTTKTVNKTTGLESVSTKRYPTSGTNLGPLRGENVSGDDHTETLQATGDSLYIETIVSYNNGCLDTAFVSNSVGVFPEFDGTFFRNRLCVGDSGAFEFTRTVNPDIPLKSALWQIFEGSTLIQTYNTLTAKPYIDPLIFNTKGKNYTVSYEIVDANDCKITDTGVPFVVDSIKSQPSVVFDNSCANKPVSITVFATPGKATYWTLAENYTNTLDSAKYFTPTASDPVMAPPTSYTFDGSGIIPITVFIVNDENSGRGGECRSRYDTTLILYDIPEITFTNTIVCSGGEPTVFTNTTDITGIDTSLGVITKIIWDFGDGGSTLTTEGDNLFDNVEHIYAQGGNYTVTVTGFTNKGCGGSGSAFSQNIYVKQNPIIGYYTEPDPPIAFEDLDFFDDSEIGGATIVESKWSFEDGEESIEVDPLAIRWEEVSIFEVKHSILTSEGCYADTIFLVDLNTYLELPNAFSPNGDGVNDDIGLLDRSIKELNVFKIFNRWGQVVFDAEGDLTARWDGTYNGKLQEVGVYVVHVNASDAYGKEHDFKINLKLIR